MTNEQILTKAIDKAIANGWDGSTSDGFHVANREHDDRINDYAIIYSHDFAKALWGEEDEMLDVVKDNGLDAYENHDYPAWQKHLMQMVIADDPIKYLGEHL